MLVLWLNALYNWNEFCLHLLLARRTVFRFPKYFVDVFTFMPWVAPLVSISFLIRILNNYGLLFCYQWLWLIMKSWICCLHLVFGALLMLLLQLLVFFGCSIFSVRSELVQCFSSYGLRTACHWSSWQWQGGWLNLIPNCFVVLFPLE